MPASLDRADTWARVTCYPLLCIVSLTTGIFSLLLLLCNFALNLRNYTSKHHVYDYLFLPCFVYSALSAYRWTWLVFQCMYVEYFTGKSAWITEQSIQELVFVMITISYCCVVWHGWVMANASLKKIEHQDQNPAKTNKQYVIVQFVAVAYVLLHRWHPSDMTSF